MRSRVACLSALLSHATPAPGPQCPLFRPWQLAAAALHRLVATATAVQQQPAGAAATGAHGSSRGMATAAARAGDAPAATSHAQPPPHQQPPPPDSSSSSSSAPSSSLDKREAAKFAALADKWWDAANGPFAPLHALNAARCTFLRQGLVSTRGLDASCAEPLAGLRVLDVGCGGGLLSEPLARMGARVLGIDVSHAGVAAAAAHAAGDPLLAERIEYRCTTLEDLVSTGATFDVVMASEVIEHVRRPQDFMACLAAAAAPGHGQVFITTLNRTPASYALAILGAEHILRIVPAGTHAWTKFLTPQEVAMMGADAGLQLQLLAGAVLQPATGQFVLSADDVSVNYAALLGQVQPEQERQAGVQQVGTARTGALGRAASRYRSQQAQQAAM